MRITPPLLALALAGCAAAPTRQSQPNEFKLEASGQIAPSAFQATTDCIMDGFDGASIMMSNVATRQQRRVGGYRVDLMTTNVQLASVDILETGKVEFRVSSSASLLVMDKERAVVTACIEKFR